MTRGISGFLYWTVTVTIAGLGVLYALATFPFTPLTTLYGGF